MFKSPNIDTSSLITLAYLIVATIAIILTDSQLPNQIAIHQTFTNLVFFIVIFLVSTLTIIYASSTNQDHRTTSELRLINYLLISLTFFAFFCTINLKTARIFPIFLALSIFISICYNVKLGVHPTFISLVLLSSAKIMILIGINTRNVIFPIANNPRFHSIIILLLVISVISLLVKLTLIKLKNLAHLLIVSNLIVLLFTVFSLVFFVAKYTKAEYSKYSYNIIKSPYFAVEDNLHQARH